MNSKLIAILGTAALMMSVASAHHSFSAEFDANKPVTLEGTVTLDDRHVQEDLTALASRYAGAEAGPGIAANIAKTPHVSLVLSVARVKTFGKV